MISRTQQRIIGAFILLSVGFFVFPMFFSNKKEAVITTPAAVPTVPENTEHTVNSVTPTITFTDPKVISASPTPVEKPKIETSATTVNSKSDDIAKQIENVANSPDNIQSIKSPIPDHPSAASNTDKLKIINANASSNDSVNSTAIDKIPAQQTDNKAAKTTDTTKKNGDKSEAVNTKPKEDDKKVAATANTPTKTTNKEISKENKTVTATPSKTTSSTTNSANTATTTTNKTGKSTEKTQLPTIQLVSASDSKTTAVKTTTTNTASVSAPSTSSTKTASSPTTVASSNSSKNTNASTNKEKWALQVGVFSQQSNAQLLQQRYVKALYPAYIETVGGQFRVRIGPYPSQSQAQQIKSVLSGAGNPASIVKIQ